MKYFSIGDQVQLVTKHATVIGTITNLEESNMSTTYIGMLRDELNNCSFDIVDGITGNVYWDTQREKEYGERFSPITDMKWVG